MANLDRLKSESRRSALGGLVVKAGLGDADRAFLLGAFLEIAAIEIGSPAHQRMRAKGAKAFGASVLHVDGSDGGTHG